MNDAPQPLSPRERAVLQRLVSASDPTPSDQARIMNRLPPTAPGGMPWFPRQRRLSLPAWALPTALGMALGSLGVLGLDVAFPSAHNSKPAPAPVRVTRHLANEASPPLVSAPLNPALAAQQPTEPARGLDERDDGHGGGPLPEQPARRRAGRPHPAGDEAAPFPAPPPARRSTAPPSEVEMLRSAAQQAAGDAHAAALATLTRADRRFPAGMLTEEREVLRAETLCKQGHSRQARERVRAFLVAQPASPLRERMRGACRPSSARGPQP